MLRVSLSPTSRRLLPLYIASFLQGLAFWYAIEKLFMIEIGFNFASIGLMATIMSAYIILIETPSGILADRWSRKGVMILGCLALAVSSLIGGLSNNEFVYIICALFWGTYSALGSGTYDSVIYDTLAEEQGDAKDYDSCLGRFRIVEGVALIIGALCGGLIAGYIGMRSTYFLTIPILLVAAVFLWRFREPLLHKAEVADPVFLHIRQTFSVVLKNHLLLPVVVSAVGFGVLLKAMFEFTQLWFISLSTPVVLFGVVGAAVFATWGFGGLLVKFLRTRTVMLASIALVIVMFLGLIFVRNYWVMLGVQVILGTLMVAYGVILTKKLHDELPSKLRAGSASVVNTLARSVLVIFGLVFTTLAQRYSVFSASYLFLGLAVLAIIAFLFTLRVKHS